MVRATARAWIKAICRTTIRNAGTVVLLVVILFGLTVIFRYIELSNAEKTFMSYGFAPPVGSCQRLLAGDKEEIKRSKLWMKSNSRLKVPDIEYLRLTKDCKKFKKDYVLETMTKEEKEFPIAFSIVFHKDVEQVERLLKAIYRPQNLYCIHVDADSPRVVKDAISAVASCFENVFLASRLEKVVYIGPTRLQADINCMADLDALDVPWKYFINTVGQAFPLKTNLELVRIFKTYNGKNDIEGLWNQSEKFSERWEWQHTLYYGHSYAAQNIRRDLGVPDSKPVVFKSQMRKTPPPHGIKIVKGSVFGAFSREFVHYVVTDPIAQELLAWTHDTFMAEELYFSTLHHLKYNPHLKTPGGFKGDADSKGWLAAWVNWWLPSAVCDHKWVRTICILGVGDIHNVIGNKYYFLNKIYLDQEYLAYECLEEWHYNRTHSPFNLDMSYYQKQAWVTEK